MIFNFYPRELQNNCVDSLPYTLRPTGPAVLNQQPRRVKRGRALESWLTSDGPTGGSASRSLGPASWVAVEIIIFTPDLYESSLCSILNVVSHFLHLIISQGICGSVVLILYSIVVFVIWIQRDQIELHFEHFYSNIFITVGAIRNG